MQSRFLFSALILFVSAAYAQDLKPFQAGKLLQVDSVPCHAAQKAQEPLCAGYVLQADSVVFHIRSKSPKHAVPLPVGERAQFRIQDGNILLHMDGVDSKEREYIVVSIAPRSDSSSADAAPVRLNHLQ